MGQDPVSGIVWRLETGDWRRRALCLRFTM